MEPVCSSVYTAGWKTRPFQIVSTNMEQEDFFFFFFFRPAHSHSYHRRAIKVLEEKNIHPAPQPPPKKPDSCLFSIEVALWSYEAFGGLSLHGLFLWHSKSGDYPNVKVIYLVVHPLLGVFFFVCVCVVRKRGAGPYCIS